MVTEHTESRQINIRRGSYDSLDLYEITKEELEILKQGSPNSIFLNFSIALLSIFISIGATLLTIEFSSDRVFYIFIIVLVVSLITGLITLILWRKGENLFNKTIEKIESRIEKKKYESIGNSIIEVSTYES